MKKTIFILTAFALLLSACSLPGAEETPPPITSEDIQETAISMAWTMAAETQAAMPTATFPPTATFTPLFTETPIFTATPLVTNTPLATNTPLPTSTSEADECNKFLSGWSGSESLLLVDNETNSNVIVSLYLYQSSRGYCGYLSGTIEKRQSLKFTIPIGYYYISVWTAEDQKQTFTSGKDLTGIINPDKHTVFIRDGGTLKF
ncbi:MAG: hypothetical protein HN741_12700, partial [Anaerolineae bacterium]|nr:hypothetical protein [Anaerolineae bacterium]